MIIHPSDSRGTADHGWLKSRHTFSFADYYDSSRMGYGALRVINDDFIAPGMGFGRHPHRDMEVITIPLEGVLKHEDSEGNSDIIRKGEVQIMSAGTGIFHSEYNASSTDPVKLLQIWVLPKIPRIAPRYEQKPFEFKNDACTLIVSPNGKDGSLKINQDAYFSLARILEGHKIDYHRNYSGNGVYVFIISGDVEVLGQKLSSRDAVGVTEFEILPVTGIKSSEVLIMEVPLDV